MSTIAHTEARPQAGTPAPTFAITGAAHLAHAAAPTMVFAGSVTDPSGRSVQSIALTAQAMIDPARRGYTPQTRARLTELFGPPAAWTPSTQSVAWARVSTVIPAFAGETAFALQVPCTYDLEVAATKFFYALDDGVAPLSFHFNGTVFYHGPDGRLQVVPVPWSASARFGMPVAAWRAMVAEHYPGGGWIRLSEETLAALNGRRAARGMPTFDACLKELLEK